MNLFAAVVLLLFASGRWIVPVAAWLSPVFLLRFARGGRPLPRLAIVALAQYAVGCVAWWGMVPVPAPGYFGVMLAICLPWALPYVLDRLLTRGTDFSSTLAFPCAWVATEYLIVSTSPYGSWGLVGYTQVDNLPLLQSAAVAGLWGIGFLMAWFAAVVNWAWQLHFEWARVRTGSLAYAFVLGAVLALGGARLALAPPRAPTIRIASLTVTPPARLKPWDLLSHAYRGATLDSLRTLLHAHEDSLFAAVRREAAAGARLVLWSEVGVFVLKDDEAGFQARASAVAREAGVHLVVGVAVFTPGQGYYENELMAFDPAGAVLARYHKARPVPGDPERGADRAIPVFDTGLGRMAGAVCFDADFPALIASAGRARADLLVIPSSDWRAIDPVHTRMALVRGVENGCSVIRQTNQGLSAAADDQGRILAASDFFHNDAHVMVAQIPSRGVRTLYPVAPQLFPYACLAALAYRAASLVAMRRKRSAPEMEAS